MLKNFATLAKRGISARLFSSTTTPDRKVCILGAAGGIGQPLGLLMKMSPAVTDLALFDIRGAPGVAADIGHINHKAKVTGYQGDEELAAALKGSDLVIIPAGVPRKPGMTRDDLFSINAGIVKNLIEAVATHCPGAIVNMISNPVNSTVPIAAEVLKSKGVYDPKRLFGVTTLDVVRAKTFYAEKAGISDVRQVDVPVIGGHAGITILPIFSRAIPEVQLSNADIEALTERTQNGGTEVVEAKDGAGSATLSMAYAGALFADACLRGLNGSPNVAECAYVETSIVNGVDFFATKVKLGVNGAEEVYDLGSLSEFEASGVQKMVGQLGEEITKGRDFVQNN